MKPYSSLWKRQPAADRAGALDPEPVEAGDEPDADQQAERRGDLRARSARRCRGRRAASTTSAETSFQSWPWLRPSNVTVPIITVTNATVPGRRIEPRQPAQRPPQAEHAVAGLEDRDPREQVEVDRERLAVARPRLDAPHVLRGERQDRVADDGGDEHRRVVSPQPDTSSIQVKTSRATAGRPAPEPLGVRPVQRRQQPPERPERAERAVEVAEQDRGEHQPDPERDQQERRRPVVQRRAAARGSRPAPSRRAGRRRSPRTRTCTAVLANTRPPGSGRQLSSSSFGFGHSTASAKNEITSTAAAAHANSHCGIGSCWRWTSPWAEATAGTSAPAASAAARTASARLTART